MIIALWIVGILAALCGIAAAWVGTGQPSGDGLGAALLSVGLAMGALLLTLIWLILMTVHLWPSGVVT